MTPLEESPARASHAVHVMPRGDSNTPGGGDAARLPAPTKGEVLGTMEQRMALKDAEIALVVAQHAATLTTFLSWNAKHFSGKIPVRALTPRDWLTRGSGRRCFGSVVGSGLLQFVQRDGAALERLETMPRARLSTWSFPST